MSSIFTIKILHSIIFMNKKKVCSRDFRREAKKREIGFRLIQLYNYYFVI